MVKNKNMEHFLTSLGYTTKIRDTSIYSMLMIFQNSASIFSWVYIEIKNRSTNQQVTLH